MIECRWLVDYIVRRKFFGVGVGYIFIDWEFVVLSVFFFVGEFGIGLSLGFIVVEIIFFRKK